jgi:hypothetical protein
MCVKMVGFNWVFKTNELNRMCGFAHPVNFFVSFLPFFNHPTTNGTTPIFNSNLLLISLSEICFPQKYMFYQMHSVGFPFAALLFLFSSKGRPVLADCIFSFMERTRPCPSFDGLPLSRPFMKGNTNYNTTNRQGELKEN